MVTAPDIGRRPPWLDLETGQVGQISAQHAYLFGVMCTPGSCEAGGQYVSSPGIPEAVAAHRLGFG